MTALFKSKTNTRDVTKHGNTLFQKKHQLACKTGRNSLESQCLKNEILHLSSDLFSPHLRPREANLRNTFILFCSMIIM